MFIQQHYFQQSRHKIDFVFRHGFGVEESLLLTQIAPAIIHDTTRLSWIDITQWDCHIHADAVRALSLIFLCISSSLMKKVQD